VARWLVIDSKEMSFEETAEGKEGRCMADIKRDFVPNSGSCNSVSSSANNSGCWWYVEKVLVARTK